MKSKVVFYRCSVCGNIVELIHLGGGTLVCCGQNMTKLEPNTTDAAQEKHVPVATKKDGGIFVEVGSVPHPMTDAHYIQWIAVVTDNGIERINLGPGQEAKAFFCCKEAADVYEYCNLHGLWKSEIK